ncbi:MAG TPA: M28 family peptidase [Phycisphaerales bacterium]|nr:M28 family peptidase [Phycisphaerales bacterium]
MAQVDQAVAQASVIPKRGRRVKLLIAAAVCVAAVLFASTRCSVMMPGDSFKGPLPAITPVQLSLAEEMRRDVQVLAGRIGERNVFQPHKLAAAEDYIAAQLAKAGYRVEWQTFPVNGVACSNLIAELRGTTRPDEIVIVGAHYDAVQGCPAANDNGSGTAATMALARHYAGKPMARTVRFVLFVNEEPPFFWTDEMGSLVYARACKQRGDNIVGMLSLETMGYFTDVDGSQSYPPPVGAVYPKKGNFIGFVGMGEAEVFVKRCVAAFRRTVDFPSEGAALSSFVPMVGASDHWSFWKQGYPALMVTDTAPYRYPHYHKATDTPDKLDYERMARVVTGLMGVVNDLAGAPEARE